MLTPLIVAALAALVPRVTLPRRDTLPATAADSALATLFARDSATRLVLTPNALRFGFTERGGRRIRRSVDSASAARSIRTPWFDGAALARSIADGITRDMRMVFPLADVREVHTEGDMLTVCFATRPPDTPPCAEKHRFIFTGATAADVQRFVEAVDRARGAVTRATPR